MKCVFCNSDDVTEVKDTMTIQQGLNKIVSPADHYECNNCGREFSTHEQRNASFDDFTNKKHKLKMEDNRPAKSKKWK